MTRSSVSATPRPSVTPITWTFDHHRVDDAANKYRAEARRRTVTSPVAVSTSTSAIWTPKVRIALFGGFGPRSPAEDHVRREPAGDIGDTLYRVGLALDVDLTATDAEALSTGSSRNWLRAARACASSCDADGGADRRGGAAWRYRALVRWKGVAAGLFRQAQIKLLGGDDARPLAYHC